VVDAFEMCESLWLVDILVGLSKLNYRSNSMNLYLLGVDALDCLKFWLWLIFGVDYFVLS
jgi:hypothetical protein